MSIKHFSIIKQTLQSRQSACYHLLIRPAVLLKGKGVSVLSAQACWSLPHPNQMYEETQTQLMREFTQGPTSNSTNTKCHELGSSTSHLPYHSESPPCHLPKHTVELCNTALCKHLSSDRHLKMTKKYFLSIS